MIEASIDRILKMPKSEDPDRGGGSLRMPKSEGPERGGAVSECLSLKAQVGGGCLRMPKSEDLIAANWVIYYS